MSFRINASGKSVLLISDQHIPYSHKDYIKFLKAIKEKMKPQVIINGGDELDYHAISFHDSDSSLFSADMELDNAIIEMQEGLHKLFPKMFLLESNHGSLVFRKTKHHGLPIRLIKPLHELYETPQWSWHHDIILKTRVGEVYICHGKTAAYGKLCKEMMMSAIQFHFHGRFEVTWHRSATGSRFNMYCGCLVDENSMAMAYGKNNLPKPILGVGYIDKNGFPHLIRMNLDKNGNWDEKISDIF